MAVDFSTLLGLVPYAGVKNPRALAYILPLLIALYYALRWKFNRRKLIYFSVRTAIFALILIAIANPQLRRASDVTVDATSVDILADASTSMGLYANYDGMPERAYAAIKSNFENKTLAENIKLRYFSRGNESAVGDAVFSSVVDSSRENTVVVLLSDGQNNAGRDMASVSSLAKDSNATVFSVITGELSSDVAVTGILGPRKTPVRAPYDIGVVVEKTGDAGVGYRLDVVVDGKVVQSRAYNQSISKQVFDFGLTFEGVGQHTIEAVLTPSSKDAFPQNNRMIKTVEVIKKASVLIIGRERNTPLAQVLSTFYNVEESSYLRSNYAQYSAVYLNDIEANSLDMNFDALRSFTLDGGGIAAVGGNRSFEWGGYNNSIIETLLPVKSSSEPEQKRKPITVLFLIDISDSTGYGKTADTKLEVEKAIAAKIIRDLKDEDEVGIIVFNLNAYKVSDITKLSEGRDSLVETLLRLRSTGGSHYLQAFSMAEEMLSGVSNDKYVILLSDGLVPRSSVPLTREYAELLAEKGAKVYAVGVGFDTSEAVLSSVAESGGGQYFAPEDYERISIEFGGEAKPEGEENRVVVHNEQHFITRNLDFGYTTVESYNAVTDKANSQVLLSTEAGDPILTVWRFGLGRVAALSTDDGRYWAPQLYSESGSKMFTALTNWVSGDLEKTNAVTVETEDVNLGESQYVTIKTAVEPNVLVKSPDGVTQPLSVRRTGLEHFEAVYAPQQEGVYLVSASNGVGSDDSSFSVNYPGEFAKIGTNLGALKAASESTGGGVYDESSISELAKKIGELNLRSSKRRVSREKPLYIYFIAAALLLYFCDACARRIVEIYKLKRNK